MYYSWLNSVKFLRKMNSSVYDYYQVSSDEKEQKNAFCEAILVDEKTHLTWEEIKKMAPSFPKGWFELCMLPISDRIEFVRGFWQSMLPYLPHIHQMLENFFSRIDDMAVFLTKKKSDEPYVIELVYNLEKGTFFRGNIPAEEEMIRQVKQQFQNFLPKDYTAFLRIHNGFCCLSDSGLIPIQELDQVIKTFRFSLTEIDKPLFFNQRVVNPSHLIPFYQSFGRNSFQCFYSDWYPASEMGNVYYSGSDHTLSGFSYQKERGENLSFTTFLDWLAFYLEEIEI